MVSAKSTMLEPAIKGLLQVETAHKSLLNDLSTAVDLLRGINRKLRFLPKCAHMLSDEVRGEHADHNTSQSEGVLPP